MHFLTKEEVVVQEAMRQQKQNEDRIELHPHIVTINALKLFLKLSHTGLSLRVFSSSALRIRLPQ